MSVAPRFTQKPSLRQDGSAVVFSCEMEADPEPSVNWYRQEMPLEADERISFKVEPVDSAPNTYVLSLVIQDAGPQDSDTYRVEAINEHGQMTANANLNLQAAPPKDGAPKFIQKPAIRQLNGGKQILFECKISADPRPTLTWFRDTVQLSEGGRYRCLDNEESPGNYYVALELEDPQAIDAATYRLNVRNEFGESNANLKLNFDVQAASSTAPSFTTQPFIRQLPSGGVVFEVSLTAHPAPSIEWYKELEAISNGGRYRMVTQTDGNNYVVTMEILEITEEDGGLYKVTARNSAGDASASFNLDLQDEEEIGETISVCFAEEPQLHIDASSRKIILSYVILSEIEPVISFSFNGKSIAVGEHYVLTKTTSSSYYSYSLEVTEFSELDSGEYGCDVRTEAGNLFKAVTVTRQLIEEALRLIEEEENVEDETTEEKVNIEVEEEEREEKEEIQTEHQQEEEHMEEKEEVKVEEEKEEVQIEEKEELHMEEKEEVKIEEEEEEEIEEDEVIEESREEKREEEKKVEERREEKVEKEKEEVKIDEKKEVKIKEEKQEDRRVEQKEEEKKEYKENKQSKIFSRQVEEKSEAFVITSGKMEEVEKVVRSSESSSTVKRSATVTSTESRVEKVEKQETKVHSSSEATYKAVHETNEKTADVTKISEATSSGDVEKPKGQAPEIIGKLTDLAVNQGEKIEYSVTITGQQPITVTWYLNDVMKLRSGQHRKITFSQGEAKFVVLEANVEDHGDYKLVAVNEFGEATLTSQVTVIMPVPEQLEETVKQKLTKEDDEMETSQFKKVDEKSKIEKQTVAESLEKHIDKSDQSSQRSSRTDLDLKKDTKRDSLVGDVEKLKQRRESKQIQQDDEDDEESTYFKIKPQNQVVKEGDTVKVECYFKKKPPSFGWYRGTLPVTTDPRATVVYDQEKLYSAMEFRKCKYSDEGKLCVQVEDKDGDDVLEFAGFSLFVKDPKDSGLDFRSLLKHKDLKKRRGTKDEHGEIGNFGGERGRRTSGLDSSHSSLKQISLKDKPMDFWIDGLEDITCQEKEIKVELACKFSQPSAKVRWYKNKLEIFHGSKYNMSASDGIFRLIVNRVAMEDAGKFTCEADKKGTSCYLTVEGKKTEYFFTQKLSKTISVKRKQDVILECMLSDPRPFVTWTKNGEKIEYTPGKYEISRRENRCILKIKNAAVDDAAEFMCEVEGDKTSCKVTTEEPDYEFEKKLQDVDSREKEVAEFECEVSDEDAVVQWFREDKLIDVNDPKYFCVQHGKKRCLRVTNIDAKDEGIYRCKVQKKVTSAKLYVSPDIIIKEKLQGLKKFEGETAHLQCKIQNLNNYPMKWFRDGEEITFPNDKYEFLDENGKQTLVVKDLKLSDSAEFSCKVGNRETSAKLQVEEGCKAPVINLDSVPREITIKAGKKLAVEIPYVGRPEPTVKWTKNKGALAKDDNVSTSHSPSLCKLQVKSASRADTGEYEVELENASGKASVPITIKVIGQ